MRERERSVVEMLVAIANTERVTAFLARYADRDEAIERLEEDVAANRKSLVDELRKLLPPTARDASGRRRR
jgi:hypothetical protein